MKEKVIKPSVVDFEEINYIYKAEQPTYLKVCLLFIMASVFIFGGFLIYRMDTPAVMYIYICFVFLLNFGFYKQYSAGVWSPILVDRECLFTTSSFNSKKFLSIPFNTIENMEKGLYGLNKRGVIIELKKECLTSQDISLIKDSVGVSFEKNNKLFISILTGIINRDKTIKKIQKLINI